MKRKRSLINSFTLILLFTQPIKQAVARNLSVSVYNLLVVLIKLSCFLLPLLIFSYAFEEIVHILVSCSVNVSLYRFGEIYLHYSLYECDEFVYMLIVFECHFYSVSALVIIQ